MALLLAGMGGRFSRRNSSDHTRRNIVLQCEQLCVLVVKNIAPHHLARALTGHAPLMTLLGKGVLRLGAPGSGRSYTIEGGFLQVADNEVRVVTERARPS